MGLETVLFLGVIGVLALVVLYAILAFNGLVGLRNKVDNAWAQIDVQLKRRVDLIPNLVETVKGYAKHEKEIFENVTKARAAMMGAGSVADKAKADNMLTGALKSLFAVSENYPQLRANENFMMLQEELSGTESKIAYARQFYNDIIMQYNTAIQTFPGMIFASVFGFKVRESFKVEESEKGPVKVKF
ncbi:LemA family protein [Candidatus Parvarchaeota archaeon]|nr:LemA family protein [Candidatus Parvarchaeota archaeon]